MIKAMFDELLAEGISRYLPGCRYGEDAEGYARITQDLGRRRLGSVLSEELRAHIRGEAGELSTVVLVDIESLGFIGRPLFLIGALHARTQGERWGLELVQYLARDYSEEEAVLEAFLREASPADLWITYNGRTFDLPFIRLRTIHYRLAEPEPPCHLDLLPVARRRWGASLPDCRLKTIERMISGRPRIASDIAGARIPAAYHDFVRTGEPLEMIDILKHNALDLLGLLDLYQMLMR